jgi:hypothetical protein
MALADPWEPCWLPVDMAEGDAPCTRVTEQLDFYTRRRG